MPHAQNHLERSIPSSKLVTAASRWLLMPRRLPQRASPVLFPASIIDCSFQIKSTKLHAVNPLPVPIHESENRPPDLPHHIVHPPRRRGNELGIPVPATNVQRHATERLRRHARGCGGEYGGGAQFPQRGCLGGNRRMGSAFQQRVRLRVAGLQQGGGGFSRDAAVARRQAETDAVYGEAGRLDAQS